MTTNAKLSTLTAEISSLESETFEVTDYAETNDLFLNGCSTCSSTTSTTSCTA